MKKNSAFLLVAQGIYYLATGLWSLICLNSFIFVADIKTNFWVLKIVSLLVTGIGLTLLRSAAERYYSPSINLLAASTALAFLFLNVFYPVKEVTSKVYLVDGIVQFACFALWLCIALKRPLPFRGISIFGL